ELARPAQAGPAAGRLVVLEAGRASLPRAGERQPLLAGDERVLDDLADRLVAGAVENGVDVADGGRAEARAVDLHQRFEPVHAPARGAVDLVALAREGGGELVGTERAGEGVIGNTDDHRAFSITWARPAASSRACSRSPTRAAGPALHSPRQ